MLAYSSIAHAGYLLAATWPGTPFGISAMTFYLLAYGVTTIASFALLGARGGDGERDVTLADVAGLGAARPWMAFALTICMLSLLGFPGTVGFMGKWYILSSLAVTGHPGLAVILVLTSVVSAGYYLPVIMSMYMRPSPSPERHAGVGLSPTAAGAIALSVAAVLLFGFWPGELLDLAGSSARTLTQTALPMAGRP
jgi:NADH-quinone oxidoreductase subunit N